ncbi:MAG: GNAT family N-acetyltransferase [Rhodobacteraceae bacterium]|nr:GNAT family N-acetyltransferase [Paracoccaceae bacterium]
MTWVLAQDDRGLPVITTGRLHLRAPKDADIAPSARFWASERSHLMGGPWTWDETVAAWHDVNDQWRRLGFGLFILTFRGRDEGIGSIGPFFPTTHPEPELGWSIWDPDHEGRGLAFEAADAIRDWFFATSGYASAVSHTDPANARSHALCRRLGAVEDPLAPHPYGDEPTLTFRHYRGIAA